MSDKTEKQAISEEHKTVLQLVESLKGNTDKGSFIVINYGKTLEYLLNALKFYKGHLEREGTTKDGVIKAMMVIREWCESRDALEFRCHECPMKNNCDNPADIWEIDEEYRDRFCAVREFQRGCQCDCNECTFNLKLTDPVTEEVEE